MKYFRIRHRALLIEYDNGTMEVFLRTLLSFQFSALRFHAPDWYASTIKQNSGLEVTEISKNEFEQLLNKHFGNCHTVDFENADIKLYHGTDAKMIRMSKEERQAQKNNCRTSIEYLYKFFYDKYYDKETGLFLIDENGLDEETKFEMTRHIDGGPLKRWKRYKNQHGLYDYPDNEIFLTSHYTTAKDFAKRSFAGGEFGNIAYFLCKAANVLFPNLKLDKDVAKAIKYVLEFGEQKREPVVFPITNLNLKYLKHESGGSILEYNDDGYRYSGPLELDLSNATFLD